MNQQQKENYLLCQKLIEEKKNVFAYQEEWSFLPGLQYERVKDALKSGYVAVEENSPEVRDFFDISQLTDKPLFLKTLPLIPLDQVEQTKVRTDVRRSWIPVIEAYRNVLLRKKQRENMTRLGYFKVEDKIYFVPTHLTGTVVSYGPRVYSLTPVPYTQQNRVVPRDVDDLSIYVEVKFFSQHNLSPKSYYLVVDVEKEQLFLEEAPTMKGTINYVHPDGSSLSVIPVVNRPPGTRIANALFEKFVYQDLKERAEDYVSRTSFQSEEMYSQHPLYYDLATFALRKKRVAELIKMFNLSASHLLAPGDGAGVVQSLHADTDSTDLYPRNASVRKKSLHDHLFEDLMVCPPNSVLLLIYVSYLLTEYDWYVINRSSIPVIVLDSQYVDQADFQRGPPFISFRGLTSTGDRLATEDRYSGGLRDPLYTEELLKLDVKRFGQIESSFFYLSRMAPATKVCSPDPSLMAFMMGRGMIVVPDRPKEPMIIDRFAQLLESKAPVYFVPAGDVIKVSNAREIRSIPSVLDARTLYCLKDRSPNLGASIRMSSALTGQKSGWLYFLFPLATTFFVKLQGRFPREVQVECAPTRKYRAEQYTFHPIPPLLMFQNLVTNKEETISYNPTLDENALGILLKKLFKDPDIEHRMFNDALDYYHRGMGVSY